LVTGDTNAWGLGLFLREFRDLVPEDKSGRKRASCARDYRRETLNGRLFHYFPQRRLNEAAGAADPNALCGHQGLHLTRLVSAGFVIYYRRMEFPIVDLARMQNVSVGLSRKMALKSP
jgi:hypothetical protein